MAAGQRKLRGFSTAEAEEEEITCRLPDGQVLLDLLEGAGAPLAVVFDRAYGSRTIRQLIADEVALAVIPP